MKPSSILAFSIVIYCITGCATTAKFTEEHSDGTRFEGRYNKKTYEYDGECKTYYSNGQLWKVENYSNGELNGIKLIYYEDYTSMPNGKYAKYGPLMETMYYTDGYFDKEEIKYYRNGNIEEKGNYNMDNKTGEWIGYYENGQVKYKGNYTADLMNGKHVYYYEDGSVYYIDNYKNGIRDGEQLAYFLNGKIKSFENYENGNLIKNETYNKDGSIVDLEKERQKYEDALKDKDSPSFFIMAFAEDDRDGEFKFYYDTGELRCIVTRSKGEHHGTTTTYYRTGEIAGTEEYNRGKLHGEVKNYFKNGNIQLEGNFKNGKRDGIWKQYDETGKVTSIVFDNNNEVKNEE